MKILVTGSSGFVGKFLTKKLIDAGKDVVGLDIKASHDVNGIKSIIGDILNEKDIDIAADHADMIINLAAKHHDFGVSEEEFYRVNVQGTKNLFDCACRNNINKFVFVSSVAVYEDKKMPVDESAELNPDSLYGKSKLKAENLVREWVRGDKKRSAVIVRPTVVFGPYNYANMYNLINSIHKGRFFFVGSGHNIKSLAYVENLVDAIVFYMEKMKSGLEVFNYSDKPHMTTGQIVEIISRYLKKGVPRFNLPLRPVFIVASLFDLCAKLTGRNFPIQAFRIKKFTQDTFYQSRIIEESGFKPRITLEEGLKNMVEWYLSTKVLESR